MHAPGRAASPRTQLSQVSKLSQELKSARDDLGGQHAGAKKLKQQLLQQQANARVQEANCKERLSTADGACRAQIEKLRLQLKGTAALETQVVALRKKLQQKEAIEEAIEGKHSKLTQVYRTLESDCQTELLHCKEAAAKSHAASPLPASPSLPPPHSTEHHGAARCSTSYGHWLQLALALLLGMYIGNGFKPPRALARKLLSGGASTRRVSAHVEEVRGWMPQNVSVSFESGMKLS